FKKLGNAPKPTQSQKESSAMSHDEWRQYFSSHWNFGGVKQMGHLAMFPEELPKRLIKMFSFAGETVFDPFAGSGTTSLAAKNLGRNSIGYEINNEFEPIIKEKFCGSQINLYEEGSLAFEEDTNPGNFSLSTLPYMFTDPHKMDKKVDVKKLQFGSKLDNTERKREKLFNVKKVVSPEKLELSNGLTIKLLGVKENPQHKQAAIEYLQAKLQKRKVFLRYDNIKYDEANNLLCYVYLDNKTFINNHLIRTGFVEVDTGIDYACKQKFLKTAQK
ncbi:MAG: site-specific DNA-methyltransferase, partial [Candidatus Gastranaerophilales bacterium]|nr:site-specific DNA-methyltransferase [Candidatus Gastranaerophilales bacterium]